MDTLFAQLSGGRVCADGQWLQYDLSDAERGLSRHSANAS